MIQKLSNEIIECNGLRLLLSTVEIDAGTMRDVCFQLIDKYDNAFIALTTKQNKKIILNIALSKKLVEEKKLNASEIINEMNKHINVKGGGQPFFAVASGDLETGVNNLFNDLKQKIKSL